MKIARPVVIAFVLSALFVVACRLPSLVRPIWNVDEAFTAVTANAILQGGTPYLDSVDHRAPVTYFVYALIFALAGKNNMLALHVALIGAVVGIMVLIALLARKTLPQRGVVFTIIYFAVVSTLAFYPQESFAFHTEWVVIVFTSLGVLLCWRALDRPQAFWSAFFSGVCFGLACFTKQPAFLDLLATLTFLGVLAWVGPEQNTGVARRQVQTAMLGILLGVFAVVTIVFGYFMVRGAWSDFVFYVWTYNTSYYMQAMPLFLRFSNMYLAYYSLTPSLCLQLLAACGGLLCVTQTAGWYGQRSPALWRQFHVALWGVSSLLAALAGARLFGHYFVMLLPPWCLLAGAAFDFLLTALRHVIPADLPPLRKWRRIALVAVIVVGILAPHLVLQVQIVSQYQRMITDWVEKDSKDRLLTFIQRECPPDQRIIVWGFGPVLYVEANRDPATRFSYTTFIVGLVPGVAPKSTEDALRWAVPGAMGTFLNEVVSNRPLLIVDIARNDPGGFYLFPLDRFLPITSILSKSYELVPEFAVDAPGNDGTRVYRRRDNK